MSYQADVKILATQLRVGDRILVSDAGHEYATVTSVQVKTKYVYVKFEDADMDGRWSINEYVTITREQLTALEERTLNRTDAVRQIRRLIERASELLDEARSDMHDAMAYGPDWHWHRYEEFIRAQTIASLWNEVTEMLAATKLRGGDHELDLYGCTEVVIQKVTYELLQFRFTSRSTSTMNNTVNDIVMAAKTRWVRDLEYIVFGG